MQIYNIEYIHKIHCNSMQKLVSKSTAPAGMQKSKCKNTKNEVVPSQTIEKERKRERERERYASLAFLVKVLFYVNINKQTSQPNKTEQTNSRPNSHTHHIQTQL